MKTLTQKEILVPTLIIVIILTFGLLVIIDAISNGTTI